MSFASETKDELCSLKITDIHSLKAEYYGLLLFCRSFSYREIALHTENQSLVKHFTDIVTEFHPVIIDIFTSKSKRGNGNMYTLTIPDGNDRRFILDNLGYSENNVSLRINRANFEDEYCVSAFLRGAFLACGAVTNPRSGYHLEFSVSHMNLAYDLSRLISEISALSLEPKVVTRRGNYIVYVKGSEHIADLLTYMGAFIASMQLMQEKIVKDVRNTANRKANSDFYNMNKSVTASAKQRKAIMLIDKKIGLDNLSPDLSQLAKLRLENPDMSLKMLAETISPPLSRSGVNHRMTRLMELAESLKLKDEAQLRDNDK